MKNFMRECKKTHNCEGYHSKIEKNKHFPQKVYRLSNPRSCDSEFRILISVQKMCHPVFCYLGTVTFQKLTKHHWSKDKIAEILNGWSLPLPIMPNLDPL